MYEILILEKENRIDTAILEDGHLQEYIPERRHAEEAPGEIYMGQILRRVPGLEAAFVTIGTGRPAFLPLDGRDMTEFKPGRELPVQIKALPGGEKGAVVSDQLSFTGRYVVVTPQDARSSISSKITAAPERRRLKALADALSAEGGYGFILRTEAQGQPEEQIRTEALRLQQQAAAVMAQAPFAVTGKCLYRPEAPWMEPLLALPADTVERILTDSKACFSYLKEHLPSSLQDKLMLDADGRWTPEDRYRIGTQLKEALARQVFLPDGGYLFIEETEALNVIDVNSAIPAQGKSKEAAIWRVNCQAAREAMAQIRLRNLSGIILIDFIDMKDPANQAQLISFLKEEAKKDRQKVTVFGLTKLGLMEMTRERRGLPLSKQNL